MWHLIFRAKNRFIRGYTRKSMKQKTNVFDDWCSSKIFLTQTTSNFNVKEKWKYLVMILCFKLSIDAAYLLPLKTDNSQVFKQQICLMSRILWKRTMKKNTLTTSTVALSLNSTPLTSHFLNFFISIRAYWVAPTWIMVTGHVCQDCCFCKKVKMNDSIIDCN